MGWKGIPYSVETIMGFPTFGGILDPAVGPHSGREPTARGKQPNRGVHRLDGKMKLPSSQGTIRRPSLKFVCFETIHSVHVNTLISVASNEA